VHVSHGTIDGDRFFDQPHLERCFEVAGAAVLDPRVSGFPLQQRQPADLQFRTGADQQVGAARLCNQRGSRLDAMGILHRGGGREYPGTVAGKLRDERGPFRLARQHVQDRMRRGSGCQGDPRQQRDE
jgi:hypothetical protein